jgi:hypothetical protein
MTDNEAHRMCKPTQRGGLQDLKRNIKPTTMVAALIAERQSPHVEKPITMVGVLQQGRTETVRQQGRKRTTSKPTIIWQFLSCVRGGQESCIFIHLQGYRVTSRHMVVSSNHSSGAICDRIVHGTIF